MNNTVQVRKHDKYRALLSDVLPYETPMIFSNHGLHQAVKSGLTEELRYIFSDISSETTRPYGLNVTKPNGDHRELHVPHPAHQLEIARFIYDHSELIISCCSVSNYTIRSPFSVTSYFKQYSGKSWRQHLNKDMEVEQEDVETDNSDEDGFANSFFVYKKYTLLYKYYKSLEYLSLEKKFRLHGKFDISKCFPSIYTHSLAWAIKGKEFSKKNKNADTFESRFDKLMMKINDGETHGIIVGPEFSRIFAEIILQRVDIEVEKALEKLGYINGKNYKVHRYVDDYFIYSNSESLINIIKEKFKSELVKFKLYTNESKDLLVSRPFITNLGVAKAQVESEIVSFFQSLKCDSKIDGVSLDLIRNPYSASQSLINKTRLNVKLNDVAMESFSGLVFSIFRDKISLYLKEILLLKESKEEDFFIKNEVRYTNFVIFCLDYLFFIYSQNVRVRTSFLMSQVLVLVSDYVKVVSEIGKNKIEKKIRDESRVLFSILESDVRPKIETVNLILSISHLFRASAKVDERIKNYFSEVDNFDYFNSITCMYVLCKNGQGQSLLDSILKGYENALFKSPCPLKDSDLTCFLLDLVSFPEKKIEQRKKRLIKIALEQSSKEEMSTRQINKTYNSISKAKYWFVDWSGDLDLRKLLVRKDSQNTYS